MNNLLHLYYIFRKSVRIEAFRESTLREVLTRVEDLNGTFWRLHVDANLASNSKKRIYGRITLDVDAFPKGVFHIDVLPNFYDEMVWSGFLDFNKVNINFPITPNVTSAELI